MAQSEIINGKDYVCEQNDMGITRFRFEFSGKTSGKFCYANGQGYKEIPFGVNYNLFGRFPQLGYSHLFVNDFAGYISDDHVPVNEIARIPCIDIIHNDPTTTGFGTFWHTVDDDMDIIDKQMLGIVGTVVLNVIYNEK